jgi:hypothetical protein
MGNHLSLTHETASYDPDVFRAFWAVLQSRGWSPYRAEERVAYRMTDDLLGRTTYDPAELEARYLSGSPFAAVLWLGEESCFFNWRIEPGSCFISITSDRLDEPDHGLAELLDMLREIIARAPGSFLRKVDYTVKVGSV